MTVTLNEKTSRFIEDKVREGEYASAEHIIEAALAMLQLQERQVGDFAPGELAALIAEGEADIAAGRVHDGEEVFRELDEMIAHLRRERTA